MKRKGCIKEARLDSFWDSRPGLILVVLARCLYQGKECYISDERYVVAPLSVMHLVSMHVCKQGRFCAKTLDLLSENHSDDAIALLLEIVLIRSLLMQPMM